MTDRTFTLLGVHLDGATVTARKDGTAEADEDGGCLAGRAARVLLVLAVAGAVAVAARALGEDETLADLAALDDAVP